MKWICEEWRKANGIYISKELNSTAVTQVRPISLLNVEGKIFVCHGTKYLKVNKNVDTVLQTGGVPGIPKCLDHAFMIWEAIQKAKTQKVV